MNKYFSIKQISCGWIAFTICDDSKEFYYDVSYMSNFPDDFMLALLTAVGQWPKDERHNRFTTDEEPTFSEWEVSSDGNDLVFDVVEYESLEKKKKQGEVSIRVNRNSFLKDFLNEMDGVLNRYGLLGFRKEWEFEFPLSLYLCLKDYYLGQSNPIVKKEISDDWNNLGSEYQSTDFNLEKKMM